MTLLVNGDLKRLGKNGICSGYYYCAYDKITSYSSEKEFDTGTLLNLIPNHVNCMII